MRTILTEDSFYKQDEVVNQIIKEIENAIHDKEDDIYIVIHCDGGEVNEVYKFAWYIGKIVSEGRANIHLVADARIQSGGLSLFLITNCTSKTVLPFTVGMQHLGDRMAMIREIDQKGTEPYFAKNELDKINARGMDILRYCGMSEEKIEYMEQGNDLWMNTEEISSLIENSNKYENLLDVLYGKKPKLKEK